MSKRISQYFRGNASQIVVGCVLAIAIVALLEASVVYDEECGRGRGWDTHFSTDLFGEHTVSIHHAQCCLKATLRGDIEFSPDEREVRRLSPGAYLEIREQIPGARRRLEVRPGTGGEPEYSWFVDRRAAEFDDRARNWLQAALPRLYRVSGLDAEGRVGRLLAAGGLAGVVAEIPKIPGDHVRALYLEQALIQMEMETAEVAEWLRTAGRYVSSDFELGRLLSGLPASSLASDAARAAYVDTARTIGSDFELRRLLAALIDRGDLAPETGDLAPETLEAVLAAATTIGSDFEQAALLIQLVENVGRRPRLAADAIRRILESSLSIGSDTEQARLLIRLAEIHPITADLRPAFEHALTGVGSEYEHGRVSEALAASSETGLAGDGGEAF